MINFIHSVVKATVVANILVTVVFRKFSDSKYNMLELQARICQLVK